MTVQKVEHKVTILVSAIDSCRGGLLTIAVEEPLRKKGEFGEDGGMPLDEMIQSMFFCFLEIIGSV